MPESGRPAGWSDFHTSHIPGESRLSSALRWKTGAARPGRGTWAIAIPALSPVQPGAAEVALLWQEQESVHPCHAPGGVPVTAALGGPLPRVATPVLLQPAGRTGTIGEQAPDWKKSALPEQAGERPTCRLLRFSPGGATGTARDFPRASCMAPAGWSAGTVLSRPGIPCQASGAAPAAGHWTHRPSADQAAAGRFAVAHGRPAPLVIAGRIPALYGFQEEALAPVRMAAEGGTPIATQTWTGEGMPRSAPDAPLPGGSAAARHPLPRFGFCMRREMKEPRIAAGYAGSAIGGNWLGGGALIESPCFLTGFPASRGLQHLAARPLQQERISTSSILSSLPPASSSWQPPNSALRIPERAYSVANCVGREGFWPVTRFAGGPPDAVRQPASGPQDQAYLYAAAVVPPPWHPLGLDRILPRPAVSTWTAERSTETPLAPSPAASWRPPESVHVEAEPAAATPAWPVLPGQWKPDPCAYRVAGAGRADWSLTEAGQTEWSSAGIPGSAVVLPVYGAAAWVSGFGRQFEFGAGVEPARIRDAGAGPLLHPERLRLPHLVCRFPREGLAGNMGMGGHGSSVFRFSGMSREESFG